MPFTRLAVPGLVLLASLALPVAPAVASSFGEIAERLPAPESPRFCVVAQQLLAETTMEGNNTLFTDMPSYRHSKPFVNPLRIYQVVTWRGAVPIVVSCKVKTTAHLRAAYGPRAAGRQATCQDMTALLRLQAVQRLRAAGQDGAAERALAFVIDPKEPYVTGQAYLGDFTPSYQDERGVLHLNPPGLFQDYDRWYTRILPERVQGQQYCHLPTAEYIAALATGEMTPGTVVTTQEDAPVRPPPGH